jgi:hypothetical protein
MVSVPVLWGPGFEIVQQSLRDSCAVQRRCKRRRDLVHVSTERVRVVTQCDNLQRVCIRAGPDLCRQFLVPVSCDPLVVVLPLLTLLKLKYPLLTLLMQKNPSMTSSVSAYS